MLTAAGSSAQDPAAELGDVEMEARVPLEVHGVAAALDVVPELSPGLPSS